MFLRLVIIIIINSLTARVVWAPQMILQPVFSTFPCSPLPSGTCWTPGLSIPWCCLPTSSSVCLAYSHKNMSKPTANKHPYLIKTRPLLVDFFMMSWSVLLVGACVLTSWTVKCRFVSILRRPCALDWSLGSNDFTALSHCRAKDSVFHYAGTKDRRGKTTQEVTAYK